MDKQIVKRIILERQQEVRERVLVVRPIPFEDKMNYVLVGIRRAGKSCLMVQDMQQRINNKSMKVEDFLYINFEDERIRYMQASELGVILDCYAEMFGDKKPFIYLDEVQVIDGWEQFVRRLADQQYRVMVTGSNAKMLSSEVATTLGGRFIIREVWPFSFSEYLLYHQTELHNNWMFDPNILRNIARQMDSYLANGGFAETFNLIDKREWVNSLYQKILMGDIVARNNIRNIRSIRLLAKKLAECVTQPVSLTRLQNIVKSTGERVSLTSVKDYLQYFEDSYMTFALTNFVSPFTEQETIKKRYFEVDFYIPEADMAVQASTNINDSLTLEREVKALVALHGIRPLKKAVIVTRDQEDTIQTSGINIEVMPVYKWILLTDSQH